jgi:hypothetical protein
MEPTSVNVTEMLQRLSNRVDTFLIELSQVRDAVITSTTVSDT